MNPDRPFDDDVFYVVLVEYENDVQAVEAEGFNNALFWARFYAYWPGVWTVTVVDSEVWGEVLYEDGVCAGL